ncbi:hypothetical protein D1631_04265 [Chryseobacterium nematophagum]|uniref:DUF1049 domain-containing protein n=2 Tax=Chryseobacterium TaxID=59732 RepID=A0A3M7LEZ8_9FLAO|nr:MULTISPECIES: hypothetical protein [Chryseobacterium]RMZ60620.1 hypothetical protein D1632_01155 [Chryseobacterium nematophagum]RNA61207.1 hypothetical protein D1631_04265 [Chryseobacterium nematophagum]CAA7195760.1 hypothetical protein CHRY9293_01930 [Chryseobacterium potabilaquae]
MKSLSITGLVLLALSALLFYLTTDFTVEKVTLSHIMGVMAGIGIGLIIGGMVGYMSKGSAIKADQKKREFKQLQKDKAELEKQASEIAKREAELQNQNKNPQSY